MKLGIKKMKMNNTIDIKVNIKLSLWSAIKLRIAGYKSLSKQLQNLSKTSQIKEVQNHGRRSTTRTSRSKTRS